MKFGESKTSPITKSSTGKNCPFFKFCSFKIGTVTELKFGKVHFIFKNTSIQIDSWPNKYLDEAVFQLFLAWISIAPCVPYFFACLCQRQKARLGRLFRRAICSSSKNCIPRRFDRGREVIVIQDASFFTLLRATASGSCL